MTEAVYNTIGKTYDDTRQPDAEIVQSLLRLLGPSFGGRYLDVACGSGNYTNALTQANVMLEGIDISQEMLSKARIKNPNIRWHHGDAKALPFPNESFNGALCTLATHHMDNFEVVFQEVYRVMKPGRFVMLTATPQQMEYYWLCHYFPMMLIDASRRMSPFSRIEEAYHAAGFINVNQEPFFVTPTLTDWFLYAGKYRPQMYLDPAVRAGISSFHVSTTEEEVTQGLKALKCDIDSGKINDIIQDYESDMGDYLFVVGEKQS